MIDRSAWWGRGAVLAAVLWASVAPAPLRGQIPDRSELAASVDSIAMAPIRDGRVAGMSVGVIRGQEILVLRPYGMADLELHAPTPAEAVYEIGSITKQFTAAAVLLLAEAGKIDLDADLTDYLPDYDTKGRKIPVRRLMDHTSGIRGYTEIPAFWEMASRDLPPDSVVALFEAEPFDFEPGQALIYNNSAYFLLGLIIEKVTGGSYADYVQERLFRPAGMTRSRYCSNQDVVEGRAHGYVAGDEGLRRAEYINMAFPFSAGALCSTVLDLVRWNRALHGGRLLSPESYRLLTTPEPLGDGTSVRYAKGLIVEDGPWGRVIQHGGGIPGFLSDARYYPERDLIVVVLVNTAGPPGPAVVADQIVEKVLGPAPEPSATPFEGDPEALVGAYRGRARGRELTVRVEWREGELRATMEPGGDEARTLRHVEGRTFQLGETRFIFQPDPGEGPARVLRLDQPASHYRLDRVRGEG